MDYTKCGRGLVLLTSPLGYTANLALSIEGADAFFKNGKRPTPTGYALAVGIVPDELAEHAAENPVVMYALYRLREYGEGYLFDKVTGAIEYIKMVNDIIRKAESIGADDESGVEFKSA